MTTFVDLMEPYFRFWPYLVACAHGALLAIIDRRVFSNYVFAALPAIIAIGGAIGMNISPFTFSGEGYYIWSLLLMLFALAALAGYALAAAWHRIFGSSAA